MSRTTPCLSPGVLRLLTMVGTNIRLGRLRRRLSAESMARRVGISRKTLARAERGDSAVALGIYARILQELQLEESLASIAADDALGHALLDAELGATPKLRRRP